MAEPLILGVKPPTIPGQVESGGPLFDMPHPEELDEPQPEPSLYEIFQAAVGA